MRFCSVLLLASGLVLLTVSPSRSSDVPLMYFRSVPEDDTFLGKRVAEPKGGYSIRPPADWVSSKPKIATAAERKMKHRSYFRDSRTGDFLDVGLLDSPPGEMGYDELKGLANVYVSGIRKTRGIKVLGSDVFRFNGIRAIQIMTRKSDVLFLQLILFPPGASMVQLTFGMAESRYAAQARAIEAVIASFQYRPA